MTSTQYESYIKPKPKEPLPFVSWLIHKVKGLTDHYPEDANMVPCFYCNASGFIKDPEDRDPVEGLKLARRIPCPRCNGKKAIPLGEYFGIYKQEVEKYEHKKKVYEQTMDRMRELAAKLNKEDIDFLNNNPSILAGVSK